MKFEYPFVAVDWGTTHMRAKLCTVGQTALDGSAVVEGPGISRLRESPAETLLCAIRQWIDEFGRLDLLLGGMVGSNLGWRETPYLSCPLMLTDLGSNLETFEHRGHRVAIVPGVSCINTLGQPDVMRGEEVQILGWLSRNNGEPRGDQLLCLPGTHTKWVRLSNYEITRFTTSLTGELFALLTQHSVLVAKGEVGPETPFDVDAFKQGVDLAGRCGADLLHAIFSTRSRKLVDGDDFGDASSFLSGLLIGADVRSAIGANHMPGHVVEVIGAPALCERFAMAIEQLGCTSRTTDGGESVHAGFLAIAAGGV